MKNILLTFLTFLFAATLSSAAFAQQACYMPEQTEAEQGLRIHTELMVIGLNCQNFGGAGLYSDYKDFTRKHAALLSGYERTLISYYRDQGARNPEGKLHDLRTKLANTVATQAARMQPNVFCHAYMSRIAQANAMDDRKIRQWAQASYRGFEPSHKPCNQTAMR